MEKLLKLVVIRGLFVALMARYDEATKNTVKAAGFRFHWGQASGRCYPNCAACKVSLPDKSWWTDKPAVAALLVDAADDEARALLAGHTAVVEASKAASSTTEFPCPAGLSYLPYQRAGIEYALSREGVLFGDEPGLGKTIQALGVLNADPTMNRVLVVCPASLRINWLREAQKWLVREYRYYVAESAKEPVPADATFVIVSDAAVAKLSESLMGREWDALILDEAHRVKNARGAQRSRAVLGEDKWNKATRTASRVRGLVDCAKRKMFLTGTPMPNGRPVELQPLAGALNKKEFGFFMSFAKRYANARHNGYGYDFSGCNVARMPELQERLRATIMVRRMKADVLTDLPAKRRQVIVLPTNGAAKAVAKEQKAYAAHEETLETLRQAADFAHANGDAAEYEKAVRELKQGMKVAFEEMSAARQEVAIAKVPAVVEHANGLLEETDDAGNYTVPKLVVFAHHHAVVDTLMAAFGNAAVRLDGRMSAEDKQASVDAFQTNQNVRVFVGSIGAAGVGLTLTAAAHMIFAELDWVPGNVSQAEDRCHRIGQTAHLLVQHLVLDGSVDSKLAQAIVNKQERCDAALDNSTVLDIPEVPAEETVVKGKRASAPALPSKYPVVSAEIKAAALSGLRQLAGMCDGAVQKDGCGFNRNDSVFGHKLAGLAELSDGQAHFACRMLRKYHGQLGPALMAAISK